LGLVWVWMLGRAAFDNDDVGVAITAVAAPILALAAGVAADRLKTVRADKPDRVLAALPAAAIVGSSLLALLLWSHTTANAPIIATATTALLALTVAAGVRLRRLTSPWLGGPAFVAVFATAMADTTQALAVHALWLLVSLVAIAVAGLDAALHSDRRRPAAIVSAVGVAAALTFAAPALATALPGWDWAVDVAFAMLFAGGAIVLARRSDDPMIDWTQAAWIAGSAEIALLALHAGLDLRIAPTAYGLLGLALAGLAVRAKWRGFAESAVAACLISFAGLLSAPVAAAAILGKADWLTIAGAAGTATLAQAAAWRVLKARDDVKGSVEAISTSAVLSGLVGAFLVLNSLSQVHGRGPAVIDAYTDDSIRTVLVLAAGLVLSIRGGSTRLGRLRGPVLLGLGGLMGLLLQGLALHPWWGAGGAVSGPPIADGLMLGLLAPALLLAEAARRLARQIKPAAGAAAITALLFLVLWMVSEIRRLAHGPILTGGGFGYGETAAYAAGGLVLAVVLDVRREWLRAALDSKALLARIVEAISWTAVILAMLLLGWTASPWWGPLSGALRAPFLLGLIYLIACVSGIGLAYIVRLSGRTALAQTALAGAGIEVFVLLTLVVRFAFHGVAMRAPLSEDSLETWTFSAVWALYGLATLAIGAGRRDMALRGIGLVVLLVTTGKVFLFDMGHLQGVIRAASFLALGLVLLVGAMAARRFGAATRKPGAADAV
jgi:hypothetical protein